MAGLNNRLAEATARHCAAFFHRRHPGEQSNENGIKEEIRGRGTITFVEFEGDCYGITNKHVIGSNYREKLDDGSFFIALEGSPFKLNPPVFVSDNKNPDIPFDIAVFKIKKDAIQTKGKKPALLEKGLLKIEKGNHAIAVGFPAGERNINGEKKAAQTEYHVSVTCQSSTDRKLIFWERIAEQTQIFSFGGMSGGGIFKFDDNGDYKLAGIIYQGRGFADNGNLFNDDIWIWGFPIYQDLLVKAFSRHQLKT